MNTDHSKQVSRRNALRLWLAGASSLTLFGGAESLSATSIFAAPADQNGRPRPRPGPRSHPDALPMKAIAAKSISCRGKRSHRWT